MKITRTEIKVMRELVNQSKWRHYKLATGKEEGEEDKEVYKMLHKYMELLEMKLEKINDCNSKIIIIENI